MYRKHSEKMVKDSYTPQEIKLQVVLFYLSAFSLLFGIAMPFFFLIAAIMAAAWFLTAIPFLAFALRRDFAVAIASPFLMLLRTVFFGAGLAYGFLHEVVLR